MRDFPWEAGRLRLGDWGTGKLKTATKKGISYENGVLDLTELCDPKDRDCSRMRIPERRLCSSKFRVVLVVTDVCGSRHSRKLLWPEFILTDLDTWRLSSSLGNLAQSSSSWGFEGLPAMANEKNIEAPYEENVFGIGEMENAQIRNGKILI